MEAEWGQLTTAPCQLKFPAPVRILYGATYCVVITVLHTLCMYGLCIADFFSTGCELSVLESLDLHPVSATRAA